MNQEEIELEKEYNKHQLIPYLKAMAKEYLANFKLNIDYKIAEEFVAYLVLYKQLDLSTTAGLMHKAVNGDMQLLESILDILVTADVVDFNSNSLKFITKIIPDSDTQRKLDKFCYPLPMIATPLTVTKNNESPMYTVKRDSQILRDNYTDEDINLDYLNQQNQIELEINQYAVEHNTKEYKKGSREVFDRFCKAQKEILDIFKDKPFHLLWKYDKRGRSYDQGYHIHIQDDDYGKSLIMFHHKE